MMASSIRAISEPIIRTAINLRVVGFLFDSKMGFVADGDVFVAFFLVVWVGDVDVIVYYWYVVLMGNPSQK